MKTTFVIAFCALGGIAGAIAACTVTNTNDMGDAGTRDAGPDTGLITAIDAGDAGADACSATASCAPVGTQTTFEKTGTCGYCDKCIAASCCGAVTAAADAGCFEADDAGNDCVQYQNCVNDCLGLDASTVASCSQTCSGAHSTGAAVMQGIFSCKDFDGGACTSACQ